MQGRIVVLDEPARTAEAAARAMRVDVGQIVKSLVVAGPDACAVLVLGGHQRADLEAAGTALGWQEIRMARPDEAKQATGYAIGGMPPVGHDLPTLLDNAIAALPTVYGGGGRPEHLLEIAPQTILDHGGRAAPVGVLSTTQGEHHA